MNPRILLVAGLAGSGKTPYLAQFESKGWTIFDDFKANAHVHSSHFRNARRFEELIRALRAGRDCVISDMGFCRPADRAEAEAILRQDVPAAEIEWQFFENDPERCAANIRAGTRPPGPRLAKVWEFTTLYSIPAGATILPVWRQRP